MTSKSFSQQFGLLILLTWMVPPVAGLSFLVYIGMFTLEQIWQILITPLEPAFICGWLGFSFWYFRKYARPIARSLDKPGNELPDLAIRRMQRFPLHYFGLFTTYLLMAPSSVILSAQTYAAFTATPVDWFRIHLVALIVSIIVGLPIFFSILDLFGKVMSGRRLTRPHVTITMKVFLIGAMIPLLIDTMIVQYYWTRTGYFTAETFLVWLSLELLAILGSLMFVKSFGQSLQPLACVLEKSPACQLTSCDNLSPCSTDELGVLATGYRELLGNLQRLGEYNTLLLESTGDGIFGVDSKMRCTFANRAACDMLGFPTNELIGQDMHTLVQHSYEDGRPLAREESLIYRTVREGKYMWSETDVLWCRGQDPFPVQYSCNALRKDGEITGAVVVFRNIAEARAMVQKMEYLATHDPLTALINRREFEHSLGDAMKEMSAKGRDYALCYIDLDQFKVVNDTCGHLAGDELLRQLASILQGRLRKHDILARLGGDEFGLLFQDCSLRRAVNLAHETLGEIQNFRFVWEDKTFAVGASIGMVVLKEEITDTAGVLSAADTACYIAKDAGRNRVHIYEQDDEYLTQRQGEMQWVSRIREALDRRQFVLAGQLIKPITEGDNEAGKGLEVLVRMLDDAGNMIPPGAFLPAAERYNLMPAIDRWVVEETLQYIDRHGDLLDGLEFCTINLSGCSFGDEDFLEFVVDQLGHTRVPVDKLCFEITETAAVANLSQAINFIGILREYGCRFALDDFGSGMSSFNYLKNLPVDFLKIDGNFVRGIARDPVDRAMVAAIHQVGNVMGIRTIAEFVENDEILATLSKIGVDYAQGFGISRPQCLEDILCSSAEITAAISS